MSAIQSKTGDTFSIVRDMIEVTSMHRPDTGWTCIDLEGHTHCWFVDGEPAVFYHPGRRYELPTLKWVVDGHWYSEDGDEHETGHHECKDCGEKVEPGYCADAHSQYVPGLTRHYVNDRPVSRAEFLARAKEAFPDADWMKVEDK